MSAATHPAVPRPARPLQPPASPPAPAVPKLIAAHIAKITEDLKSARIRCATFWRALHEQTPMRQVGVMNGDESVQSVVALARYLETNGHLPGVRFARSAEGIIIGIELGVIEKTAADEAEGVAPTLDMATVIE